MSSLPRHVPCVWLSSNAQDHSVSLSCGINCGRCPRRGRLPSSTRSRSPDPTHATSNKRNLPIENYIIPQFYLFIFDVIAFYAAPDLLCVVIEHSEVWGRHILIPPGACDTISMLHHLAPNFNSDARLCNYFFCI